MVLCIFYKDRQGLNYCSEEHIFPAALGGKEKLPKGFVSDEANAYFSKLEKKTFSSSLISMPRMLFGPGSRGTDKLGEVQAMIMKDDSGEYSLGYMFKGSPYQIPHIKYDNKAGVIVLCIDKKEGKLYISEFLKMLKSYNGKMVTITNSDIPSDQVLIGVYQKKYFIGTSRDIISEDTIKQIIDLFLNNFDDQSELTDETRQLTVAGTFVESPNDSRVFLKIAFNVIARHKGEQYILHSTFDDARDWLMDHTRTDNPYHAFPTRNNSLSGLIDELKEHSCIIFREDNYICAEVNLYSFKRYFRLGKVFDDSFISPNIYSCNFETKKEQNLADKLITDDDF